LEAIYYELKVNCKFDTKTSVLVEMLSLSSPVAKFASKHRRSFGDSVLFQVHYVLTAGILLTFVFIYCAKDFIGDPIRCMYSKSLPEDARKLIETFCYINGLYTVQNPEGSII